MLAMMKSKTGVIHVLTKKEGGRQHPPTGEVYYATTYIEQLPQPNWSIIIEFEEPMKESEYSALCQVRFLVGHAPHHILDELKEMEVYEGAKIVGKIVFD